MYLPAPLGSFAALTLDKETAVNVQEQASRVNVYLQAWVNTSYISRRVIGDDRHIALAIAREETSDMFTSKGFRALWETEHSFELPNTPVILELVKDLVYDTEADGGNLPEHKCTTVPDTEEFLNDMRAALLSHPMALATSPLSADEANIFASRFEADNDGKAVRRHLQ